jgi:Tfp pilus assembly protein PilF
VNVVDDEPPPIIKKKKPEDAGAEVAAAKKALKKGEFSDARLAIEKALEADPEHKGARKVRKRLNETQRALALGRLAYDGADCAKTIETLERVLLVSPGAKTASTMVASCRDGMPPATL